MTRQLSDVAALGLSVMSGDLLADARTGRNGRHALVALLRQSVFSENHGREMCLDESDLDTFGAESTGVTGFAEGSTGADEVAMVRTCQCPPIATISAQRSSSSGGCRMKSSTIQL